MTESIYAYAALDAHSPLVPFQFKPRIMRPDDVIIAVEYCGVCHSDLHQARNDWGAVIIHWYPVMRWWVV